MINNKISKNYIAIVLFLLVSITLLFTACSENTCNIDSPKQLYMIDEKVGWALSTENEIFYTEQGTNHFQCVHKVSETTSSAETFVNACFLNETTAYLAFFSGQNIVIENTKDSGRTWSQNYLSYQEYGDANCVYICFLDEKNGYLLYCGNPGVGQMTKILFQTTDGCQKFSVKADLSADITGYPSGIAFSTLSHGFISTTYHGTDSYLFSTLDHGATWQNVKLEPCKKITDVSYIEADPPVFHGEDRKKGTLILKYVGTEQTNLVEYLTQDGGLNWTITKISKSE
ncbi:MAG: hypothetical protein UFG06_10100 [Lachnospiraceae bacterium]|nr:hypothetical protein [Lachnospiraceae bacterium]